MKPNKKQLNQIKNTTVTMKKKDIAKLKQEATQGALDLIIGFSMLVLRDKFGYGKKNLMKFHSAFFELNEAYNEGRLSLEDIIDTLEAETKIEFNREKPEKELLHFD